MAVVDQDTQNRQSPAKSGPKPAVPCRDCPPRILSLDLILGLVLDPLAPAARPVEPNVIYYPQ